MTAPAWSTVEDAIHAWLVAGTGYAATQVIWAQQTAPRPTGAYVAMRLTSLPIDGIDWTDRVDNILSVGTLTVSGVSTGADTLTITAHGLATGDGPLRISSTGTVPGGAAAATDYWAIVVDANTVKLAATFANAVAASPTAIDLTSAGTGTITITGTATTMRVGAEVTNYVRGPRRIELQLQAFAGAPTGAEPTGATSPFAVLATAIASYRLPSRRAALEAAGIAVLDVGAVQSIDGVVNTVRFEPRAVATVHLSVTSELAENSTYIQTVNATNQIVTPNVTITVTSP